MLSKQELIEFSAEVARRFEAREIGGPIHQNSETQAEPLIEIFKDIKRTDFVLSTWRSAWHALLHGVPRERVMAEVLAGRSMMLHFPEYRFMTSAIMGGMLPIACGLAAGGERVFVFCGDMCASTGAFQDAMKYAMRNKLTVTFINEDNDLSTNTPTEDAWGLIRGQDQKWNYTRYHYKRTTPHYQPLPNNKGF